MTRCKQNIVRRGMLSALAVLLSAALLVLGAQAGLAGTNSLTIKKLASDGVTVLAERTVSYRWLSDPKNIPVMGDGARHYYHQGPVFVDAPDGAAEEVLRWNAAEDTNVQEKDMGALKGTNVIDLCNLVGGMAPGDTIKIKASDGFSKTFAYKNVYQYSDREGPIVVCWYRDGLYPDTGYIEGMRLVWFADASVNPWGIHAFGNWDWHQAADPAYWYYYQSRDERYPTTTGLSVQLVSDLTINSTLAAPAAQAAPVAEFSADATSGNAPLTVKFTDRSTNSPTVWAWDFDNDGNIDSTAQNPTHTYSTAGIYSVKLTVTNAAGSNIQFKAGLVSVSSAQPAEQQPEAALPSEMPLPETPPAAWNQSKWFPFAAVTIAIILAMESGFVLIRLTKRRNK